MQKNEPAFGGGGRFGSDLGVSKSPKPYPIRALEDFVCDEIVADDLRVSD